MQIKDFFKRIAKDIAWPFEGMKIKTGLKMFIGAVAWISGGYAIILKPLSFREDVYAVPYTSSWSLSIWIIITAIGLVIFIFGVKEL